MNLVQAQQEAAGLIVPTFAGFFQADPSQTRGSIQSAVSTGRIARHAHGGLHIAGKGRMSAQEAIAQGLIDQAAADYVAGLEGAVGASPSVVTIADTAPQATKPGTWASFAGTPTEALVLALVALRHFPEGLDERAAAARALEAFRAAG